MEDSLYWYTFKLTERFHGYFLRYPHPFSMDISKECFSFIPFNKLFTFYFLATPNVVFTSLQFMFLLLRYLHGDKSLPYYIVLLYIANGLFCLADVCVVLLLKTRGDKHLMPSASALVRFHKFLSHDKKQMGYWENISAKDLTKREYCDKKK